MKKFLFGSILCCLFSLSLTAQDICETQLKKVHSTLILEDYSKTHDFEYEYLDDSETDYFNLSLDSGLDYKIVAVCDEDCSDIDMWIYDSSGNLIDADELDDDTPIVDVTPRWDGKFKIKIKMYECTREPCKVGIGVFAQ